MTMVQADVDVRCWVAMITKRKNEDEILAVLAPSSVLIDRFWTYLVPPIDTIPM